MNAPETTIIEADAPLPQKRADLPAIWEDFRAQLTKLKATAETLTVTDVSQKAEMKLARATRLTLKDLRVSIEKRRKELGEEALRQTQQINSGAKELKDLIEPLETRLLEQEEFVERAELKMKEGRANERVALLRPLGVDCSLYNLREMTDEQFNDTLAGIRAAHEAKIAAVKKAEEDRLAKEKADAEERERIRLENERLKQEAAEKEAALKVERERVAKEQREASEKAATERKAIEEAAAAAAAKAESERKAIEQKARAEAAAAAEVARKEREAIEAKAKAEREAAAETTRKEREAAALLAKQEQDRQTALREAAEAAARAEQLARQKAEAELKAKAEAEAAERKAVNAAQRKADAAPDKEKLICFAQVVRGLSVPECKSEEGKAAALTVGIKVEAFAAWIETQATAL